MGKKRREEKLERRQAMAQAEQARRFSWGKFLRLSLRVLAFAVGATVLWRVLILLGLKFLDTGLWQIILFLALYVLLFRWINAETLFAPPRPRR